MEDEWVAERALDELPQRHRVHGSAQDGQQQVFDRLAVQRLQLDARRAVVLPQDDHRIRAWLPGPAGAEHAGQDRRCARLRQLVDERGRSVVEQVGVVDEEEQRSLPGVIEELVHVTAQLVSV